MPVYFANDGTIDLDVIRTMGVSVKENDNPIGYFGTGLKYAIATLLRTGHEMSLYTNGETIQFRQKPKMIRGEEFQMVMMGDEQLGFTTDLGKNWTVWQAYRELYSNCIDENGTISGVHRDADTIWTVWGPEIVDVHNERNKIFLQSEPWLMGDGIEVHRGKSQWVFYRGVRVHKLLKPTRFTYNFTVPMQLTEDRTLASVWDMNYKMGTRLPRIPDEKFANALIDPEVDYYEGKVDFSDCHDPSEEWLDMLEKHRTNAKMSENNRNMLQQHRNVTNYDVFELDAQQAADVERACMLINEKLNADVFPRQLTFVENLGPGIYALAKDNEMLITRQTVANGFNFLLITIYEEWIHHKLGYRDETRAMQQFLFDKILELITK